MGEDRNVLVLWVGIPVKEQLMTCEEEAGLIKSATVAPFTFLADFGTRWEVANDHVPPFGARMAKTHMTWFFA